MKWLLFILAAYTLLSYAFVIYCNLKVLQTEDDGSMSLTFGIIFTTLLSPIFAPIFLGLVLAQILNTVRKGLWL